MCMRFVTFLLLVFISVHADAQNPLRGLLRAMDTGATAEVIRQPDGRLVFLPATGGNFYSDRVYVNGDKDDAYNGIRTSKTVFKQAGGCKTRTATMDKWSRLLIGGYCRMDGKRTATVARLDKMGNLDKESGGMVQAVAGDSSEINALCVLADEKIMAAGTYYASGEARFFLSKHIYNGARDNTFGSNGVRIDSDMPAGSKAVAAVALQDGKMVVCGYNSTDTVCRMLLVRYNTDGARDYSFGEEGILLAQQGAKMYMLPKRMQLLADGSLLISGTYGAKGEGQGMFIAKYTKEGKEDTTFGKGGPVRLRITGEDRAEDMALLEDGTIIIAGAGKNREQLLLRLTPDGVVDTTWGYGSKKGIKPQLTITGALGVTYNVVTSPLDSRVYAVSEYVLPGLPETIVTLRGFLQHADLGIIDVADKRKQYLAYPKAVKTGVTFDYELIDSQYVTVRIMDKGGKEVGIINKRMKQEGGNKLSINFPEMLPPGRYEAILTTAENYTTSIEITKQ